MVESDITDEVSAHAPETAEHRLEFQRVMHQPVIPAVPMGGHCADPHPCPYLDRCAAEVAQPEYPVSLLSRGGVVVERLLADGYWDLRDVTEGLGIDA